MCAVAKLVEHGGELHRPLVTILEELTTHSFSCRTGDVHDQTRSHGLRLVVVHRLLDGEALQQCARRTFRAFDRLMKFVGRPQVFEGLACDRIVEQRRVQPVDH